MENSDFSTGIDADDQDGSTDSSDLDPANSQTLDHIQGDTADSFDGTSSESKNGDVFRRKLLSLDKIAPKLLKEWLTASGIEDFVNEKQKQIAIADVQYLTDTQISSILDTLSELLATVFPQHQERIRVCIERHFLSGTWTPLVMKGRKGAYIFFLGEQLSLDEGQAEMQMGKGGLSERNYVLVEGQDGPAFAKIIDLSNDTDNVIRDRAIEERHLTEELESTGKTPKLIETIEKRGRYVLVLELIRGMSIRQFIQETNDERTPEQSLAVFVSYLEALYALHKRNVISRDIKPENAMISVETGQVILIDFGLGFNEAADHKTEFGRMAGTPAYMGSEHKDRAGLAGVTKLSDIFATGLILYELLAGKRFSEDVRKKISNADFQASNLQPYFDALTARAEELQNIPVQVSAEVHQMLARLLAIKNEISFVAVQSQVSSVGSKEVVEGDVVAVHDSSGTPIDKSPDARKALEEAIQHFYSDPTLGVSDYLHFPATAKPLGRIQSPVLPLATAEDRIAYVQSLFALEPKAAVAKRILSGAMPDMSPEARVHQPVAFEVEPKPEPTTEDVVDAIGEHGDTPVTESSVQRLLQSMGFQITAVTLLLIAFAVLQFNRRREEGSDPDTGPVVVIPNDQHNTNPPLVVDPVEPPVKPPENLPDQEHLLERIDDIPVQESLTVEERAKGMFVEYSVHEDAKDGYVSVADIHGLTFPMPDGSTLELDSTQMYKIGNAKRELRGVMFEYDAPNGTQNLGWGVINYDGVMIVKTPVGYKVYAPRKGVVWSEDHAGGDTSDLIDYYRDYFLTPPYDENHKYLSQLNQGHIPRSLKKKMGQQRLPEFFTELIFRELQDGKTIQKSSKDKGPV